MDPRQCDAILVPVDFTEVSDFAIDHAVAIARIFGYRLYLLHVLAKRHKGSEKENLAEHILLDMASRLKHDHNIKVTHMIRDGNVMQTISAIADKLRASFIVMGVHGKKGVTHLAGSYPYKVVCKANVPVLVVKDNHQHVGFHNIVIPIDFSKRSTQKITQAIKFSRFFGAKIRVYGFLSSYNKAKIINKEALLKSVTGVFQENQVPVTTDLEVDPGYAWPEALLRFSDRVNADLIMIVAERGGRIQEIFSPNYSERILDKADIPVLTIIPCDEDIVEENRSIQRGLVTPFVDPFGLIVREGT